MIFFTSDQHFGHTNVIKYTKRPFQSVEEMDQELINKWNEKVSKNDIVYHLSDFTLGNVALAKKYFIQLNGIISVLSNPWHHDKRWLSYKEEYYSKNHPVKLLPPMIVLEEFEVPIVLCHYPLAEWDRKHYGSWHLHAHSHGNYIYPNGSLAYDVGIDNNN